MSKLLRIYDVIKAQQCRGGREHNTVALNIMIPLILNPFYLSSFLVIAIGECSGGGGKKQTPLPRVQRATVSLISSLLVTASLSRSTTVELFQAQIARGCLPSFIYPSPAPPQIRKRGMEWERKYRGGWWARMLEML